MKINEKIKKNKTKEKLKKYKETFSTLWNNQRTRAIIELTIWVILILILAVIVRTRNNETVPKPIEKPFIINNETIKNKLKDITLYDSKITIEKLETIEEYEINKETDLNTIDLHYIDIAKIYLILENKEEEYITTYKDKSYIINYKISKNDFLEMFDEPLIETDELVDIKISGVNNIEKIELNLNINDIKTITINIEKPQDVEE